MTEPPHRRKAPAPWQPAAIRSAPVFAPAYVPPRALRDGPLAVPPLAPVGDTPNPTAGPASRDRSTP
jgi:hypothetical protein